MAKTITPAFASVSLLKHGKRAYTRVRYKRRYFDTSTQTYKLDATFRDLELRDFVDAGEVNFKLDTPFLNKFTSSNVTLQLKNLRNEWIPSLASPSKWAADAVSPTLGYDPMQSLFVVEWGWQLPDGTREMIALFTGLSIQWVFSGHGGEAAVVISGREYLMEAAEAAQDSDAFLDESTIPAQGDSAETVFYTTSTGVGRITQVKVAGVIQDQGGDYEIADLDLPGQPAKITFSSPPPTPAPIVATGIKWKTNSKIEDRVAALCDLAGIGAGERTIEPVDFPSGIGGVKVYDFQADWQAGILADCNATVEPGAVVLNGLNPFEDFNDNSFAAPPRTWTPGPGFSVSGGAAHHSGFTSNPAYTPSTQATGTWEWRMALGGATGATYFMFMNSGTPGLGGSGYELGLEYKFSNWVRLYKRTGGSFSELNRGGGGFTTGMVTLRVTRDGTGLMRVYLNGSLIFSASDNSHTTSAWVAMWHIGSATASWDDMRFSPDILPGSEEFKPSGTWVSAAHDTGLGNPISYGTLDRFQTLDGDSTLSYETATSADDISYDPWVPIGPFGAILSTTRRYIKVRATLTRSTDAQNTPHLEKLVVNFTVQIVIITLAIHEGRTVFEQIEVYAQIADFEIGFDGAGKFFFRAKTVTPTPVVTINQENAIASIDEYRLGYDRVINVGQVRYGPYFNEFDKTDSGESEPTSESRFGRIIRFEDLTGVLLANDVNLAAARARAIYENNYLPRKQVRMRTKMLAQLELGDVIRVSYFDHPLFERTIFGDPLQAWGGHTPAFGDAENILARDMDFKIIGIRFKPSEAVCDMTLQEVLS